ncbi:Short-chain dehydrogenase/reductase family protein [Mycena indigotica]|uniref:Short-chain dehydrogenase/reductase family protein n=1 Tax=Mycena indigotica TaxID=2126181 RepID=A0A8H6W742_9AGAR|nr:Short-chain dehydrogenase/reductase family protein [Mycena indigotica]KAF7301734.1 Short-chain dehydrogenase/reductase family protein [Mycena indigotica]
MSTPTVFISGASKGIGLAVAAVLLRKGVNVVAFQRSRTPELLALACDKLLIVDGDVTDTAAITNAVDQALKTFSSLDGLILNAATLEPLCRIGDRTVGLEKWKTHFDVNFFSLVDALQAALPSLRDSKHGGRVVFVSSGAATKGTAGWGPYNASKAAMNSLCRTLSEEEPTITSVALRPGMVDTAMQVALRETGAPHMSAKDHEKFVSVHANGELLKAEDPARVIASLAISAPKSMSGQFVSWDADECALFREAV